MPTRKNVGNVLSTLPGEAEHHSEIEVLLPISSHHFTEHVLKQGETNVLMNNACNHQLVWKQSTKYLERVCNRKEDSIEVWKGKVGGREVSRRKGSQWEGGRAGEKT